MIDYKSLLNDAMIDVVKKAFINVQKIGLDEGRSLYISFCTDHPGVVLSHQVKDQYPQEITIVLQHQFDNLVVLDDRFSVNLAFGGVSENIIVPFKSLTNFADPDANFSIQFYQYEDVKDICASRSNKSNVKNIIPNKNTSTGRRKKNLDNSKTDEISKLGKNTMDNIVMLDKFRKNHKK